MEHRVDPYRSPVDRGAPRVVDFRHFSPWWCVGGLVLVTLAFVLTSHRVELGCARSLDGAGWCKSRDVHAFWLSEGDRIDLAGIHGARLVRSGKGASKVVLVTTHSTIALSSTSESGDLAAKQKLIADVSRFLADPSALGMESSYGHPWAANLHALLFVLPLVAVIGLFTRRVRVIVDRRAARVLVQRSRFPLSPGEEDYGIDQVRSAEVEETRGGKGGPSYRVALVLAEGTRVPLTTSYSSGRGSKDRVAAQINQALQEAEV